MDENIPGLPGLGITTACVLDNRSSAEDHGQHRSPNAGLGDEVHVQIGDEAENAACDIQLNLVHKVEETVHNRKLEELHVLPHGCVYGRIGVDLRATDHIELVQMEDD